MGVNTLSKIENGTRGVSVDDLEFLALALEVESAVLIGPVVAPSQIEIARAYGRWVGLAQHMTQVEVLLSEAKAELAEQTATLIAILSSVGEADIPDGLAGFPHGSPWAEVLATVAIND